MKNIRERKEQSDSMNTLKISHKHVHLTLFIAKVIIMSQYMSSLKATEPEDEKFPILYADYGNLIIFIFFQLYATMAAISQIDVYCFYMATFIVLYKILLSIFSIFSVEDREDESLLVYIYTITLLFIIEAFFCLFMIYKNRIQIQYHLFKRYGANLEVQKAIQFRQLLRVLVYINFCNQASILGTQYIIHDSERNFVFPFYVSYAVLNLFLNAMICVGFNDECLIQRQISIFALTAIILYGVLFKALVWIADARDQHSET